MRRKGIFKASRPRASTNSKQWVLAATAQPFRINPSRLAAFYTSVTDSIWKERNRGKAAQASLVEQKKTIDTLNSQIKGSETALQTSTSKLDEISFLGIPFSKSTYNTIVWSIIIVLAIALAIVVIRSAKNIHDAKYTTCNLPEPHFHIASSKITC